MRATERAHDRVRRVVQAGETVIDATVGNGHDTLFLASCAGERGQVIGFDIQEEALALTRTRLSEHGIPLDRISLLPSGHQHMEDLVNGPVGAVMFNLGYLPGGDHSITTEPAATVSALQQGWSLLRPGGVVSVVCYRGHPGGRHESDAVCQWAAALEGAEVEISGREETEDGPFLVVVRKP